MIVAASVFIECDDEQDFVSVRTVADCLIYIRQAGFTSADVMRRMVVGGLVYFKQTQFRHKPWLHERIQRQFEGRVSTSGSTATLLEHRILVEIIAESPKF